MWIFKCLRLQNGMIHVILKIFLTVVVKELICYFQELEFCPLLI